MQPISGLQLVSFSPESGDPARVCLQKLPKTIAKTTMQSMIVHNKKATRWLLIAFLF